MFKFINIYAFIIALSIGLLFVYISVPEPTVIYVYPTPDNINRVQYIDNADNCYKFVAHEVSCTKNAKDIPIQQVK